MARLANSTVQSKSLLADLEKDFKAQQKNMENDSTAKIKVEKKAKTSLTANKIIKETPTPKLGEYNDEEIGSVQEAAEIFGKGFTVEEYSKMMAVYNTYLPSYPLKTANHKMALIKVCKCTMRYDQALADNDLEAIKLWDGALSKALKEAKINPEQLNTADLTEGITSISQLVMAVEKVKEPIGILPHLTSHPQDGADYILWQIVNYCRKVKNLPTCSYAEIYEFLEEQYEANKDSLPFLVRNVNGNYDNIDDGI